MSGKPVHVDVLLSPGVVLLEAAGIAEALHFANHVSVLRGKPAPFAVRFVHPGQRMLSSFSGLRVVASEARAREADVLVVPGFEFTGSRDLVARLRAAPELVAAIKKAARSAQVWSVCNGTFLTAEAGLLDGRRATTTWWLGGVFANRYPDVKLELDHAVVEDGRFVTTGAVAAGLHAALLLIERMASQELARTVARLMLLDQSGSRQTPFMGAIEPGMYSGILDDMRSTKADDLVGRARALIAKRLQHPLRVEALASQLNVTSRTLLRRFQKTTGVSPKAYLQSMRIERARALLETTNVPLKRVAERVGYRDDSAFRRLFRRRMGAAMSDYRRRFGFRPL